MAVKRLVFVLTVMFVLSISGTVSADTVVFRDDFDGTELNLSNWDVYENNGTVEVSNGTLRLETGNEPTFPLVLSTFDFPAGNFLVKVGMKYIVAGNHGNGFQLARTVPVNGIESCAAQPSEEYGLSVAGIWQDTATGLYVANLDNPDWWLAPPEDFNPVVLGPAPETDYHEYEFVHVANLTEISVDGMLRADANTTSSSPVLMWFGNPVHCHGGFWSSFEIDYIEVVSFEPALGNIQVFSNPDEADVFLDSDFRGTTPLFIPNVTEGFHFIEITKEGYLPHSQFVYVVVNTTAIVNVTLNQTLEQRIEELEQRVAELESRVGIVETIVETLSSSLMGLEEAFNSFADLIISYLTHAPNDVRRSMLCGYMREHNLTSYSDLDLSCHITGEVCICAEPVPV